jgi:hypothetical protein
MIDVSLLTPVPQSGTWTITTTDLAYVTAAVGLVLSLWSLFGRKEKTTTK